MDHGKSTLIGRLLYDSENITEGRVQEIQKLAEEFKKRFEFAYFLDAFDDELKEERTIDTTRVMFKGKRLYTITDVPGHREFIKNILTGASHAELAVLVVAADEGIKGQTQRHAFLLNMLGIKDLFVVVNKMDKQDYRESSFNTVRRQLDELLARYSFNLIRHIPTSALKGDNIHHRSAHMPWYEGPTLVEALDRAEVKTEQRPLRFVVQDIYQRDQTPLVVGRVESGKLHRHQELLFQPSGKKGKVGRIVVYEGELDTALTGDCVALKIDCLPRRGEVGGTSATPPRASTSFLGEAVLMEQTLTVGDRLQIRCATANVNCTVRGIKALIDSETGEIIQRNPKQVRPHEAAIVAFKTEPLVVEKFSFLPALGRFILARVKNIAAGIVLETET